MTENHRINFSKVKTGKGKHPLKEVYYETINEKGDLFHLYPLPSHGGPLPLPFPYYYRWPAREPDEIFKHKPGCEWPYKYTRAEFEAFHYNKRVWEHKVDYYTINSDYQRYEYLAESLGNAAGIGKLAGFSSKLDVESLDTFEEKLRRPTVCRRTTVAEIIRKNSMKPSTSQNTIQNEDKNVDQSEKPKMNNIL